MTGAWRLRLPPARVVPLCIRWIFQGTWLALFFGAVAIVLAAILTAAVFLALAVWPVVVVGGPVLLVSWAVRRAGRRSPARPHEAVRPSVRHLSPSADALPQTVQERINRIRLKAEALAHSAHSLEDRHLVESTTDRYLPGAVDAYLSLPPGSAEWPAAPDGRTGLGLLEHQLDMLERNLDKIAGHAWQHGTQRLLAHERFLEERLGPAATEDLDIRR
jgi:hypothetical protein